MVLCFVTLTGCETLRSRQQALHPSGHDPDVAHASVENVESESKKILDVQTDGKKTKPFFRSSRLSSGLSDEAREIENDLGIR